MALIDREALYAFLTEQIEKETGAYSKGRNMGLHVARSALHNKQITPAIDAAPVVHGRWEEADWVEPDGHSFGTIRIPKAGLRCNQCANVFRKELLWKDSYCPNCGARMDGGEEHE